ncbi:hypothetical protein ACROYT_G021234 [Oculina patagonica]
MKMAQKESRSLSCGVPEWFGIPANNTASFINDALVAAVNVPCCVFAILSNLAIIVTIIKSPSLKRPCNILMCSLAATDCLTSLTAQPIFVTLRLIIHRGTSSCSHQDDLFAAFYASIMLTSGWSFAFITVISFDRHFALSRPMVYRTSVTNRDTFIAIALTGASWFLLSVIAQFALSALLGLIFFLTSTIMFIVFPIVNHVRMFFAIRRHNNQLSGAVVPLQLTVVFRREKKVALDMLIVCLFLLLSLAPSILNKMIQAPFPKVYSTLQPWALSMVFLIPTLNPIVYTLRNKELRDELKSACAS